MENQNDNINSRYERHYAERSNLKVYPTEFVVRTILAHYPNLKFKKPRPGNNILDAGFDDG
jgi:hypothetical protein